VKCSTPNEIITTASDMQYSIDCEFHILCLSDSARVVGIHVDQIESLLEM
jgi:hypothetical protein